MERWRRVEKYYIVSVIVVVGGVGGVGEVVGKEGESDVVSGEQARSMEK